jgi:rare lipoprotein A
MHARSACPTSIPTSLLDFGRPAGGRYILVALATALLFTGCASSRAPEASVRPAAAGGFVEEGLASWYGEPYHGRPTASGERFDQDSLTAAHRTLPFGTVARVTNLDNERSVEVVVNDRGPFVAGRIVDLSRAAAAAIGAIGPGVVPARLEVVRAGDGMPDAPCWEVQVGAFGEARNVDRAHERLSAMGFAVRLAPASGGLTRVRVTDLAGRQRAAAVAERLRREYPGAVAVPCPTGRQ